MTTAIPAHTLEARARRAAQRVGLCAIKSRSNVGSIDNQGSFRLLDPFLNSVVAGERFDLSPRDVLQWCGSGDESTSIYE